MAASITFDFLSRGAGRLAGDTRKIGDTMGLAAKGAKVLQDTIEKLGTKENRTAEESSRLARALRQTGDAEDRAAAKALAADIAIRRLADAEAKAARDADTAEGKVSRLGEALKGLHGPGFLGSAALLSPTLIPVLSSALPVIGAVTASLAGAGIAAGAFGLLAKTAFTDVNDAATKYQAAHSKLLAAGPPFLAATQKGTAAQRASAQASLISAEASLKNAKGHAAVQAAQLRVTAAQARLNALQGTTVKANSAYTSALKAQQAALAGLTGPQRQLVTSIISIKTQWHDLATSVATPVIAPWTAAAAAGLTHLRPLVQPVADLFRSWGQDIDRYFTSKAGSAELGRIAASLGKFGAGQLRDIGTFLLGIGRGVAALGQDLAGHHVDFGAFGTDLARWGTGFASWSKSAAARKDVSGFLAYLHQNGPLVTGILKDVAKILPNIAGGLSGAGTLELKVISGFLGFVSKLPPGLAKPLLDTAGALLLLQKTGVVKVGLQILTSGTGGAAAGAAGAAEGAAAGGIMARLLPKGTRLLVRGGVVAFSVAAVVSILQSTPNKGDTGVPGQQGNWWETPFGMPGPKSTKSAGNWLTSWSPYENFITKTIPGWFSSMAAGAALAFGRAGASGAAGFGAAGHAADTFRTTNLAPLRGAVGQVSGGIQGLAGIMQNTMLAAMRQAGAASDTLRTKNLAPLLGQVGKVSGGIQGLQGYINALHGKNVSVGAHLSGSGGVQVTPSTGAPGAKNYAVYFKPLAKGGRLPGFGGGDIVPAWIAGQGPAMLEPGEAVVDKYRTRKYAPVLKAMGVPGMAAGGLVGNLAADAGADVAAEARASLAAITAAIRQRLAAINPFAGITGVPSGGKIGAGAAAAQAFARSVLWAYGWGQNQFPPLQALWNGESGWRWNALNPASGAYGIPQSLPASKMASAGADWRTNPATQIRWGLPYIKQVYKSPSRAYSLWLGRTPHWYASGGLVPGYASGGTVARQGRTWLDAWRSRHGGGFGAARGPVAVNEQIARMAAALSQAQTLAGAHGLTAAQHRYWTARAADEKKRLGVLHSELTTERAWRGQLGASDTTLAREIAAAGHIPSLAGPVRGWKAQIARQKAAIAAISGMLGYSDAYLAAHKAAAPGPKPAGVTHVYGGDVADTIAPLLASALAPFRRGGLVSYDRGGWLKPGTTMAYNGTNRPEMVVPAGGGGTMKVVLSFDPSFARATGLTPQQLADIRATVHRVGGGSVERAFGRH